MAKSDVDRIIEETMALVRSNLFGLKNPLDEVKKLSKEELRKQLEESTAEYARHKPISVEPEHGNPVKKLKKSFLQSRVIPEDQREAAWVEYLETLKK